MFQRCFHCGGSPVYFSRYGGMCSEGYGVFQLTAQAGREGRLDLVRRADGRVKVSQRFWAELTKVRP